MLGIYAALARTGTHDSLTFAKALPSCRSIAARRISKIMYRHGKSDDPYPVIHISEAAVKHLIRQGHSDGDYP